MHQYFNAKKEIGIKINFKFILIVGIFILILGQINFAQKRKSDQWTFSKTDEWRFTIAPYFWTVNIGGESYIGKTKVPVDIGFGDIADNLKMAGNLYLKAIKEKWGYAVDFSYLNFAEKNKSLENISVPTSADYDMRMIIVEAQVIYNVYEQTNGAFQALGGLRYNMQDLELNNTEMQSNIDGKYDQSWIDPFIGVLARYNFSNNMFSNIRLDLGGFGIGSIITFNTNLLLGYMISKHVNIGLGYKYQYLIYDDGEKESSDYYKYSANQSGLVLGIGFHF